MNFVLVFLGGGLGALTRYLLSLALPHQPFGFPFATLCVNVLGCLLIGCAASALPLQSVSLRLFLMAGVLGGFTTYSAFALENAALVQGEMTGIAVIYTGLTIVTCFAAVAFGLWFGKGFLV